ncbi:CAD20 protein, partial [Amia calva]|nr:CAD20 protein [Amia calva]
MDRGDGSIRYILSGEGAGTMFTIDDNTGDIHAIQRLDREEKAQYILRAQALHRQTGKPLEPESEFIVKIQDINDNEPKFLDGPYKASVPEMSVIGTSVMQLTATDADDPTYGNSARVVYSILQGQPYFSVEPRTVRTTSFSSVFYLEVINLLCVCVCVSAVENTYPQPSPFCFFCMSITLKSKTERKTEIQLVTVVLPSINWMWLVPLLSYLLSDISRLNCGELAGIIRVSLPNMDREAKENYEVIIQAKDMGGQLGGLAGTTTVNITLSDVNDNPPKFAQSKCFLNCTVYNFTKMAFKLIYMLNFCIFVCTHAFFHSLTCLLLPAELYQMSVPESAPVGSVVGRVRAKDLDEGINAEMRYTIIDGDGRDTFDISTDTTNQFGIITIKKKLDFETKWSYTLKVEGANTHLDPRFLSRGPFSDVTIIHISVEDVDEPPQFDSRFYFVEVPEDIEIGTVFQSVSAKDPDVANNSIRYSIERKSDPGRYFYIDITSGALMTARPLDREELSWHNITVLAMEMISRNHRLSSTLIQTVTAVDLDEPLGGQHFYYSLAPEAANNPNFTLRDNQDNTAWILTRRAGFTQQEQSIYYLPIFISDGEQPMQSSTSTLTIRVCSCDSDGNIMSCNAEAYTLPVTLSRGALIAILACIFVLLVMILLILSLRSHRKKPYLSDEEENVHENIVRYDDEGGGEEDTEAFDIAAMWNPREAHLGKIRQDMLPEIESLSRYVPQTCMGDSNVHGYVLAKLYEADGDPCAPPYDSLQTYAYEGEGSVAESLSSLQSITSNTDHDYDYLSEWGPRFKKLAEMYGVLDTNDPLW